MAETKDFLFTHNSWFDEKYKDKLHSRFITTKIALGLMLQTGGKLIVETGCQKDECWGAGRSTTVFQDFINRHDCELITIDNNSIHLNRAKQYVGNDVRVKFVLADSALALSQINQPIDFLYLDSWDYPYFEVTDMYGGRENFEEGQRTVEAMSEEEFIGLFNHIVGGCQQHTLNELVAALPFIHKNTVVLIDDCKLAGGGKGRIARDWMFNQGWRLLFDDYQTLWLPPADLD